MSRTTSLLPFAAVSLGAAVIIPVLIWTMYTTWRARVEARNPSRADVEAALKLQATKTAPVPLPPEPAVTELVFERPVDEIMVMQFAEILLEEPLIADAQPDAPFRIELERGEDGLAKLARIDLERDGKIDEVWHLPQLLRDAEPGPDGQYTKHFKWENRWIAVEGG